MLLQYELTVLVWREDCCNIKLAIFVWKEHYCNIKLAIFVWKQCYFDIELTVLVGRECCCSIKLSSFMERRFLQYVTVSCFFDRRLVSWCFEPNQPQRIISANNIKAEGDFHKEIVERTNEREIRPKEQSEKAESCRENFWMKYSWKDLKDRNRHKKERASSVGLCQKYKPQHPHHVKVGPRGLHMMMTTTMIMLMMTYIYVYRM